MLHGMFGYGMNGMGWGMDFGWLFGITLIVVLIWAFTRRINTGQHSFQTGKKSALDILKERYAKGEINKEEFEEKKHAISQ